MSTRIKKEIDTKTQALIVDFYGETFVNSDLFMNMAEPTIEDLLFIHRGPTAYMTAMQAKHDIGGSTVPRPEEDSVKVEKPLLRCIHLPANDLDWVEVMNLLVTFP